MSSIRAPIPCWCSYHNNSFSVEEETGTNPSDVPTDAPPQVPNVSPRATETPEIMNGSPWWFGSFDEFTVAATAAASPSVPVGASPIRRPLQQVQEPEPLPEPLPELLPEPSRRVNLAERPWDVFRTTHGSSHCPGRNARYTLSIKPGGLALLELQTWSGIYRQYRFWLRNLENTLLEVDSVPEYLPYTVLTMRRGSPIKLLFESVEEARECHEYLFTIIGR